MEFDLGIGLGAAALVIGFPLLLLGLIWFLGRLEAWMLAPDERAAAINRLLEQVDETEELERAVALMMSDVTGKPAVRGPRRRASRRRALQVMRQRARNRSLRRRASSTASSASPASSAGER